MAVESDSNVPDPKLQHDQIKHTIAPTIVAEPLKSKLVAEREARTSDSGIPATVYEVIIELNLDHPQSRVEARAFITGAIEEIVAGNDTNRALERNQPDSTHPYVFARLTGDQIIALITRDGQQAKARDQQLRAKPPTSEMLPSSVLTVPSTAPTANRRLRAIFRIWESQKVYRLTTQSIRTVKADAAQVSFGAGGDDIVWAVLDSGVNRAHPHFVTHGTLELELPLESKSFVPGNWYEDRFGHGTHVAGIIAGEAPAQADALAALQSTDEHGGGEYHLVKVAGIKGMAPNCKLLVLRVLDDRGVGDETALIEAIEYIQKLNDYGRNLLVHGVNISAGYWSDPKWYGCGQTPLCVEVDRLVRSGVIVVAAAGNSGQIFTALGGDAVSRAGQMMSINDPGNAALAITVGSTHREKPHLFGVSYFSSKGPTSDGRRKPEVLAPGERIISCASRDKYANDPSLPGLASNDFGYIEDSGTSMAAPHVSGIIAAFLSVRREYIGRTAEVRALLAASATDLGRDPNTQGSGLVDLMRLIQSV